MLIMRRAPARTLRPRGTELDTLRRLNVPLNVTEDAEGYTLTALVPGLTPETIEIQLDARTLTIGGELRWPKPAEGSHERLRELPEGRFERSISFAFPIDGAAAQATYTNGVLTLRLPKAEAARSRRIAVTEGEAILQ
jgi:HSP20 family protein